MTSPDVLSELLVIFSVSIAVVFVFHKFRVPTVAGFLAAGALIGPYGLNLVSDLQQVHRIADMGVVLLLFTIGIEFSLAHLAATRRLLLFAGPIQVTASLVLVALVASVWGLPYPQAIFWGCLLSLSSTAIVLKALADQGQADSPHGRATIGILIFQDLAVVPMMLLTPVLARPAEVPTGEALWTLAGSAV